MTHESLVRLPHSSAEELSMHRTDVAIIGAGPAGLTAGEVLSRNGVGVSVLEADPKYVGGISKTVEYKGYRFDIGGHRFFSKSKEVEDYWTFLLGDEMLDRPRSSRIYYDGKFFAYPAQAARGIQDARACRIGAMWRFVCQGQGVAEQEPCELRGVGDQPVRQQALLHLLQDLHREGVGHGLHRDLCRLGCATHQGAFAWDQPSSTGSRRPRRMATSSRR